MTERLVLDASAMVDLLLGTAPGPAVAARVASTDLHTAAHFDVEVMSALGRLSRAGDLGARFVRHRLSKLSKAPIERHGLPPLLDGAWGRRSNLRLTDALYVELAHRLECAVITTDAGLARASKLAELVSPV